MGMSSRQTQLTVLVIVTFCAMALLIANGCRKSDLYANLETQKEAKFFKISVNTPEPIQRAHRAISKQHKESPFINRVIKNFGYPVWDKAMYSRSIKNHSAQNIGGGGGVIDTADLIYIPFASASVDIITGVLIAKFITLHGVRDSIFYLLGANFYPQYGFNDLDSTRWSARDVLSLFAVFESRVFDHQKLRILDSRFFKLKDSSHANFRAGHRQWIEKNKSLNDSTFIANFRLAAEECVIFDHCYDENGGNGCNEANDDGQCDPSCEFYEYSVEICTSYEEIPGGGGNGGPLSFPGFNPNSSSGGAGGWDNTNPCKSSPLPSDPAGVTGCGGLPMGWYPISNDQDPYSPYEADSIIITTNVRDSFPCIAALLEDSLPNLNAATQLILYNTFRIDNYINLTFEIDWSLTKDSLDAYTLTTGFAGDSSNNPPTQPFSFGAIVFLNPWVLGNSSHEYIVATLMHEIVHAFIQERFAQYSLNYLDSTEIVNHFPIFWGYYPGTNLVLPTTAEHEIMASNYVNDIASVILDLYQGPAPSLNWKDSISKALAWGGLDKTNVWNSMSISERCRIASINQAARDTSMAFSQPIIGGTTCGYYANSNFDSLKLAPACQ